MKINEITFLRYSMGFKYILFQLLFLIIIFSCNTTVNESGLAYPEIQKEVVVDTYHGQHIEDSYRHLEDNSEDVINWVKKQNSVTEHYLQSLKRKNHLFDKQVNHDKENKYSITGIHYVDNDLLFFLKRNANENVAKLYFKERLDDAEVELFDPKHFDVASENEFQIKFIKPNWDASKVLISLNENGKENSKMFVLDVKTKKLVSGILSNGKPSLSESLGIGWLPDNITLFYSRSSNVDKNSNASLLNTSAVIYKIGDDPSQIRDVFSKNNSPNIDINPEDAPFLKLDSKDAKYAIGIIAGASYYYDSYYLPILELNEVEQKWKPLFKKEHLVRSYQIYGQNDIYFLTGFNAANFRICRTSFSSPNFENPEIIIPEKKDEVIKNLVVTSKGMFFSTVINGVIAKLYRHHKGKEMEIKLPTPSGNIKLAKNGEDVVVSLKGWLSATERYLFNEETNSLELYNIFPDSGYTDNFEDLTIEEITVKGHDGEEIPLSLIYKKNLKRDGNNPILMRGYGAYGASMIPSPYYPFNLFIREGGIYAVPHVRGGGEKGDAWYRAGYKNTKPNTWKDIISCTEYLIHNKYTSKGKVAIWGGSAGGIGAGRALTKRPDLYGAAILSRGMLNTLRIEAGINGANSAREFGTIKDSIGFRGLYNMDAYHHIEDNTMYPATLIINGMNDSRVPPWQSFKFAAKLQKANQSDKPILLKTEFDSGHGLQSTKNREFESMADILSFILTHTGHPDYQPQN